MDLSDYLSLALNGVVALIVYSFKNTIRVAVLEAGEKIADKYATKVDVAATEERLKEQIGLRTEIREGFARISPRGGDEGRTWPVRP